MMSILEFCSVCWVAVRFEEWCKPKERELKLKLRALHVKRLTKFICRSPVYDWTRGGSRTVESERLWLGVVELKSMFKTS